MIYQPRNVKPSAQSIDATLNNTFSMEIQTNSYVSAYQLYIIDFNNEEIYTGNKVDLADNLYNGDILTIPVYNISGFDNGKDYKWHVRLYQPFYDMLITYSVVSSAGTSTNVNLQPNINVHTGMQLYINDTLFGTITSYDSATGAAVIDTESTYIPLPGDKYKVYSNFIETTPDYVVYARSTPTLSITNMPSVEGKPIPLDVKSYTFIGSYVQSEQVPIIYYEFNLYSQNDDESYSLLDSSGKIYSANIKYYYDGFRTGNTYAIELNSENEMGIKSSTDLISFDVVYDIIEYLQQPTASLDNTYDAVNISWAAPIESEGQTVNPVDGSSVTPKYLYNTPYIPVNSLYTQGSEAIWEVEDGLATMPEDFNITLQFNPDSNFFFSGGTYNEEVSLIDAETDGEDKEGSFSIKINKNKLIFEQNPDLVLESYFYNKTSQTSVLSPNNVPQISSDYIWDDDTTAWNDTYYWVEGGTSLERVCNHWWKIQITKDGIRMESIYP